MSKRTQSTLRIPKPIDEQIIKAATAIGISKNAFVLMAIANQLKAETGNKAA